MSTPNLSSDFVLEGANCPTAESKLPRSKGTHAAFNVAINGRLLLRGRLKESTSWMHCSTASHPVMTHTDSSLVHWSWPSETVKVRVWQPRGRQLVTMGPLPRALGPSDHA